MTATTARLNAKIAYFPFALADFGTLTSGVTSALDAVKLPPGAIPLRVFATITQVFNSGTSDTIDVGYSQSGSIVDVDDFVDLQNAQALGMMALASGSDLGKILSASVESVITVNLISTGTAPTTGAGFVVVEYMEPARADSVYG